MPVLYPNFIFFFFLITYFRNPRVYKYIRDSIIKRFRRNPSRKITFTEARRCVASDVLSIRKVFEFLEYWGLINYTPSAKPLSKEKRDVENVEKKESPKKLCSSCRTACTIACFATDKVWYWLLETFYNFFLPDHIYYGYEFITHSLLSYVSQYLQQRITTWQWNVKASRKLLLKARRLSNYNLLELYWSYTFQHMHWIYRFLAVNFGLVWESNLGTTC